MKKLIFLLSIIVLFSGCGLFKKVFKSKVKTYSKESTYSKSSTDSSGTRKDKSVIIETEKADTTVSTKPIEINTSKAVTFEDIVNGLTAVDTGLVLVKIQYNRMTGQLNTNVFVKPQDVNLKFDKRKETHNDITETSDVKKKDEKKANKQAGSKIVNKEKTPSHMGVWLIAVIVGLLIVVGAIYLYFKRKKGAAKNLVS